MRSENAHFPARRRASRFMACSPPRRVRRAGRWMGRQCEPIRARAARALILLRHECPLGLSLRNQCQHHGASHPRAKSARLAIGISSSDRPAKWRDDVHFMAGPTFPRADHPFIEQTHPTLVRWSPMLCEIILEIFARFAIRLLEWPAIPTYERLVFRGLP